MVGDRTQYVRSASGLITIVFHKLNVSVCPQKSAPSFAGFECAYRGPKW